MLKLHSNKELKRLVKSVSEIVPDNEALAEKAYQFFQEGGMFPDVLLNFIGKIHTRSVLEQVCEEGKRAFIVHSVNSRSYSYQTDETGALKVYDRQERVCAEYDALTDVSGLLVAWEVCLASRARERDDEIPRRISNAMNLQRIRQQIKPLEESGKDLGYVLVIYNHQVRRPILWQSDFCTRGGILLPFYYDYGQFCTTMGELMSTYGITLSRVQDMDSGEFRIEQG